MYGLNKFLISLAVKRYGSAAECSEVWLDSHVRNKLLILLPFGEYRCSSWRGQSSSQGAARTEEVSILDIELASALGSADIDIQNVVLFAVLWAVNVTIVNVELAGHLGVIDIVIVDIVFTRWVNFLLSNYYSTS